MKLAIRKEPTRFPDSFYYFVHPIKVNENEGETEVFEMMGYTVVEVSEEQGTRLLSNATKALKHQIEVATLCEAVRE